MKRFGWLAVLLTVTGGEAQACNVPVFRYALERWRPSEYEIHVFHQGPLTPAQEKMLVPPDGANVNVNKVDVGGKLTGHAARVWERHRTDRLPWVTAHYPLDDEKAPPAWAGPLDVKTLSNLFDSPARQQITRLLVKGESAVWVLLESGVREADDAAASLLEKELARLQTEIVLPEQREEDGDPLTKLPLRLSFAVVRVSRASPQESAFVRLLLGSDEGLDEVKGPIVFPVFGRGRVLFGLYGDTLTAAQLERWASFLAGACSCQVKELNPGTDLLITADWQTLLEADEPTEAQPSQPITAPPIPPGEQEKEVTQQATEPAPERPAQWWVWMGLSAGMMSVVVVTLWGMRGRPEHGQ